MERECVQVLGTYIKDHAYILTATVRIAHYKNDISMNSVSYAIRKDLYHTIQEQLAPNTSEQCHMIQKRRAPGTSTSTSEQYHTVQDPVVVRTGRLHVIEARYTASTMVL